MKNKKLLEENKNLRNENLKLLAENKKQNKLIFALVKQINEIQNENADLEIENNKLKLFKINIKSSLKQYALTIKEYINYYKIFREDEFVAKDFEKVLNFLESWIK